MSRVSAYSFYIFHSAPWLQVALVLSVLTFGRYVLTSGLTFYYFYIHQSDFWSTRKIQKIPFRPAAVRREIMWSILTCSIFVGYGLIWVWAVRQGISRTYFDFHEYGVLYFLFSVFLMVLLHDIYFYWTHRFLHWKPIFKVAHKAHHESKDPTPWASFSFHPWEALISGFILLIFVFAFPHHPRAILAFLVIMTVVNVYHHLGFEICSLGWSSRWPGRAFNTAVHHNMHHKYFTCNYGLYSNLWDTLCKTNHPQYHAIFDQVTAPPMAAPHSKN